MKRPVYSAHLGDDIGRLRKYADRWERMPASKRERIAENERKRKRTNPRRRRNPHAEVAVDYPSVDHPSIGGLVLTMTRHDGRFPTVTWRLSYFGNEAGFGRLAGNKDGSWSVEESSITKDMFKRKGIYSQFVIPTLRKVIGPIVSDYHRSTGAESAWKKVPGAKWESGDSAEWSGGYRGRWRLNPRRRVRRNPDLRITCPDAEHILDREEWSWPWELRMVPTMEVLRWADGDLMRSFASKFRGQQRLAAIVSRAKAAGGLRSYLDERPLLATKYSGGVVSIPVLRDGHHRLAVAIGSNLDYVPVIYMQDPR